jgi:hypothetical protein
MEILGELIHAFYDDPLGPPSELVDIYMDDSNEEEVFAGDCDWDIIAAYNVCLFRTCQLLTLVPRCMPDPWLGSMA